MVSSFNTNQVSSSARPEFDQIVRGKVKSVKTGCQTYRITFLQNSDFTLYQVWTTNGNNSRRLVVDDNSKQWQQSIIDSQKQTGFEPTAIMDVNNCLYAFVITNAYFDKCKRLTLEVSTKPIDNLSKTVKKGVKTGVFNARFDIDSLSESERNALIRAAIEQAGLTSEISSSIMQSQSQSSNVIVSRYKEGQLVSVPLVLE